MKKVFTLFLVFFFALSFNVLAQTTSPTVTIGTETGTSPVDVPIDFEFGDASITAFDLTIDFDETLIDDVEFVGGTLGFNSGNEPTVSVTGNEVTVGWDNSGTQTFTSSDDGHFFLSFTGNAIGSSTLTFTSENVYGENELVGAYADALVKDGIITSTFTNGSVTFDALPVPVKTWAIFLGFGLIIGFVVLRFTRVF